MNPFNDTLIRVGQDPIGKCLTKTNNFHIDSLPNIKESRRYSETHSSHGFLYEYRILFSYERIREKTHTKKSHHAIRTQSTFAIFCLKFVRCIHRKPQDTLNHTEWTTAIFRSNIVIQTQISKRWIQKTHALYLGRKHRNQADAYPKYTCVYHCGRLIRLFCRAFDVNRACGAMVGVSLKLSRFAYGFYPSSHHTQHSAECLIVRYMAAVWFWSHRHRFSSTYEYGYVCVYCLASKLKCSCNLNHIKHTHTHSRDSVCANDRRIHIDRRRTVFLHRSRLIQLQQMGAIRARTAILHQPAPHACSVYVCLCGERPIGSERPSQR